MNHIEEEARKKWCPMVRVSIGGNSVCTNRGETSGSVPITCIASDCILEIVLK